MSAHRITVWLRGDFDGWSDSSEMPDGIRSAGCPGADGTGWQESFDVDGGTPEAARAALTSWLGGIPELLAFDVLR